ncbi:MAG TPA: hypothetical protein VML19_08295, partial [Verrucomicrobiae bacterium]|nr:hypothetical protein [Verrucomicrobiae bacterium]
MYNVCASAFPTITANWITILPGTTASQFSFAVSGPYAGTTPQSAAIQVGTQSIAVTQNPSNCNFSVATTAGSAMYFPPRAGRAASRFGTSAATCAWTLTPSSSSITDLSTTSGTGNKTVTFALAENTQAAAQSATILVQGVRYTITQAGAAAQPSYNCTPAAAPARTVRAEGQ